MSPSPVEYLVFVGTYTHPGPHASGESEGIYVCRLDGTSGALTFVDKLPGIENPSYLALHPQGTRLYAVNETGATGGRPCGAVSAFALDTRTGGTTFLNRQSTHGPGPCHLSVDGTGRFVLAAHYGGGSLAILPLRDDGSLGEATDLVQHRGSRGFLGVGRRVPRAHMIATDPGNRFVLAADLGLDRMLVYELDPDRGRLVPRVPAGIVVKKGAGPRHFAFHPDGRYVYLINELDSTMTALEYDTARGRLAEIHTLSTLPEGFTGTSSAADVHVAPSGKFVYGSNRGHDSIAVFAVDEAAGRMTAAGHEPTRGRIPRSFVIDPTGTWLLAANQETDSIVSFRLDAQTGRPVPTGHDIRVPTPVCLKLLAVD